MLQSGAKEIQQCIIGPIFHLPNTVIVDNGTLNYANVCSLDAFAGS